MCRDILISLDPVHSENLLSGRKRVEIRRRRLYIEAGTRVWIYTKLPKGLVNAVAVVEQVHQGSTESIWKNFSKEIGISRPYFDAYMSGLTHGFAIKFATVSALRSPVGLAELRRTIGPFHPPQFFKRLDNDRVTLNYLLKRASC